MAERSARTPEGGIRTPSSVVASWAVYDRSSGAFAATRDPHAVFRSASIVKLLIALDYCVQNKPHLDLETAPTDAQRTAVLQLQAMLRSSWDYPASSYWVAGGFTDVVHRMVELIGLSDTSAPTDRGMWGDTATSVADTVAVYNYLLDSAPAPYRDFIVGNVCNWTKCAVDGFDQSFGLPGAYERPLGVKQGWSAWPAPPAEDMCSCGSVTVYDTVPESGEGALPVRGSALEPPDLKSPLLHSTGLIGPGFQSVVALFTTYPAGATFRQGTAVITALARSLGPWIAGAKPLGAVPDANRHAPDDMA